MSAGVVAGVASLIFAAISAVVIMALTAWGTADFGAILFDMGAMDTGESLLRASERTVAHVGARGM